MIILMRKPGKRGEIIALIVAFVRMCLLNTSILIIFSVCIETQSFEKFILYNIV